MSQFPMSFIISLASRSVLKEGLQDIFKHKYFWVFLFLPKKMHDALHVLDYAGECGGVQETEGYR